MRFLCLHGMGTNSQIFKVQTAAFRYELTDQHTYEFAQGIVPWELPAELEAISDPSNEHYSYFDPNSAASFIAALNSLEAYIEAEGPFDGVLAYSQGAGLVAMLLVRRHFLKPREKTLFRCAILFSPVQVYDPVAYLERGETIVLDSVATGMPAITIPVVIIYGEADDKKNECLGVQGVCDPNLLSVYVHQGGHEVPGMRVKGDALRESVKMARRVIFKAEIAAAT